MLPVFHELATVRWIDVANELFRVVVASEREEIGSPIWRGEDGCDLIDEEIFVFLRNAFHRDLSGVVVRAMNEERE